MIYHTNAYGEENSFCDYYALSLSLSLSITKLKSKPVDMFNVYDSVKKRGFIFVH